MPVTLRKESSPDQVEARIEIIPLIDIMFFLLASFMLVSLSMVHAMTVKVSLPASGTAKPDPLKNVAVVSIDKAGRAFLNKLPIAGNQLRRSLSDSKLHNADFRVVISGDREASHGDVIHILDLVRSAGIDKVAFYVRPAPSGD